MKKLIIVILLIVGAFHFSIFELKAETLEYPFDEIRIVEAFKFDILISELPNSDSLLFDQVELNDVLTVYIGTLVLVDQGVASSQETTIMILTTSDDIDLARWIVNSGSWSDTEHYLTFSNHIQINPTIGVVKDLSIPLIQISYRKLVIDNSYTFIDNVGDQYPMIANSYVLETDLNIIISAYVPVVVE